MDETLAAPQLERVQAMAQTMMASFGETIRPASRASSTNTQNRAQTVLGELQKLGPGQGRIELAETLGQGGMGLVRLARQTSMGRQVAVKTARADKRNERTTLKLLREAWVNGALEHPNILPIYDLGIDEAGAPVIVMRLVDGADWKAVMHDPSEIAERFDDEDPLEWNLRVLMQVCNALRYAHDRHIVHRDLKPANVMLGPFGEVYLVDWGIAVSVGDDGDGRFPVPESEGQVVGTPAYMAPEMLAGDMAKLGPRTDVYLLGAVLFEILTGEAPHRGEQIADFIDSVMRSQPNFPADTPEELASVCRKAMAANPDARFASADELRLALQAFLRHRGSNRLVEEGRERLSALRRHLESPERDADDAGAGAEHLFAESRFAFESALREWSENSRAARGLREARELMVSEHLRRREVNAAARLLAEMDDKPDRLLTRLETLRRELRDEEAERERLTALGRDHDARFGQRTRWFVLMCMGTLWSILPPTLASRAPVPASFAEVAVFPAAFLLLLGGIAYWARESLMSTVFNRRVSALLAATLVCQLILTAGGALAGWEIPRLLPAEFFLWFVVALMFVITIDHRFWPACVGYLAGYLWVSHRHADLGDSLEFVRHTLNVMGVAHLVMTLTAVVLWKPRSYIKRLPDEELYGSG